LLFVFLTLGTGSALGTARRCQCLSNITQIARALSSYKDYYQCFPPAHIAGSDGKPMHSWRVLILPYLNERALYDAYNFDEPWNGPHNKSLMAERPWVYACPGDAYARAAGSACTSYVAVVGADTLWPKDEPGRMPKAASETIMLVETSDGQIPWTEPRDLNVDSLRAGSPDCVTVSSNHFPDNGFFVKTIRAGVNVVMADGSVRFVPGGLLASDKFPDLLKVGGAREKYFFADWGDGGQRIDWPNCAAAAIWLASSGWLLVRAMRSRKPTAAPAVE
jgi:prepilin-type processing-associated H-X9-DG protein